MQQRMVRPVGQMPPHHPQQHPQQQQQQQQHAPPQGHPVPHSVHQGGPPKNDQIAYNVEHIFVENGKQVILLMQGKKDSTEYQKPQFWHKHTE